MRGLTTEVEAGRGGDRIFAWKIGRENGMDHRTVHMIRGSMAMIRFGMNVDERQGKYP